MGILVVCLLGLLIFAVVVLMKKGKVWSPLLILLVLLILIIIPFSYPPETEYPNMAKVNIDGLSSTIYFQDYQQDGMKVTIANYATQNEWDWTGWQLWGEHPEGITIMLLDNEGQFKYTDRKTGDTINKCIDATQ